MMDSLPRLAFSIRQPWTWCILHAGKQVENRDWPTRVRGSVCLHASKGMTRAEYDDCRATANMISLAAPFPEDVEVPPFDALPRGGIVGVADIVDCVSEHGSPWFFGLYGFVLANPRPVPFIPVNGALGFFEWRKRLTSPCREKPELDQRSLL